MPKTDCFFVERLSTVIQPQCNEEIRISKLRANNNEHKSFYLQSDNFAESVLAVLCSGYVVAKHKTRGCKAQNIITSWDAECGNVAFMPCTSGATLEVGTYFDICVAGYNRYKLVYDEHMGYFKISNSSSQGNADIIHVKAHVFQANKIVIVPNEHRDRDARRMRVMNVNRETTRGRHRLRFPSFDNPNNNPNTVSTSYHLTLRQF